MKIGYSVTCWNEIIGDEDSLEVGVKIFKENEKANDYFNSLTESAKIDYSKWKCEKIENGYQWKNEKKIYRIELKEIRITDEEMKRVEEKFLKK